MIRGVPQRTVADFQSSNVFNVCVIACDVVTCEHQRVFFSCESTLPFQHDLDARFCLVCRFVGALADVKVCAAMLIHFGVGASSLVESHKEQ